MHSVGGREGGRRRKRGKRGRDGRTVHPQSPHIFERDGETEVCACVSVHFTPMPAKPAQPAIKTRSPNGEKSRVEMMALAREDGGGRKRKNHGRTSVSLFILQKYFLKKKI